MTAHKGSMLLGWQCAKLRVLQGARVEMRMAFTFMPSLGASSEQAGSCWKENAKTHSEKAKQF